MSSHSKFDFRTQIKNNIMSLLYKEQLDHWNKKLRSISRRNAQAHGRRDSLKYAVFFNNQKWYPRYLLWTDNDETAYCLELHPNSSDLAAEMEIVAEELGEIEEERYEAERFLSGLVLFKAPPHIFQEVLGDSLYAICKSEIESFCSHYSTDEWNKNGEFSMETFVNKNRRIIKAMNERILVNLVTREERR